MYKLSKGLFYKYGSDIIIDTPITDAEFTGTSIGAALYGIKIYLYFWFIIWNFAIQAIPIIKKLLLFLKEFILINMNNTIEIPILYAFNLEVMWIPKAE